MAPSAAPASTDSRSRKSSSTGQSPTATGVGGGASPTAGGACASAGGDIARTSRARGGNVAEGGGGALLRARQETLGRCVKRRRAGGGKLARGTPAPRCFRELFGSLSNGLN